MPLLESRTRWCRQYQCQTRPHQVGVFWDLIPALGTNRRDAFDAYTYEQHHHVRTYIPCISAQLFYFPYFGSPLRTRLHWSVARDASLSCYYYWHPYAILDYSGVRSFHTIPMCGASQLLNAVISNFNSAITGCV